MKGLAGVVGVVGGFETVSRGRWRRRRFSVVRIKRWKSCWLQVVRIKRWKSCWAEGLAGVVGEASGLGMFAGGSLEWLVG